ncbi:MAG: DUF3192 domain-containing protein [Victivallaceae bacterium]|nr:DUF3192 domain-containing protein [Victivallaceae bacterium]
MKRILFSVFLAVSVLIMLNGCAPFIVRKNVENSKKLRINMTKAQVLEVMGEPIKDEMYVSPNVWYYYVNTEWYDGRTTEDECMPLVFKNDKLVGWGWDYFEKARIQHKYSQ